MLIIHFKFGLLVLIQIIVWICVFFISNSLLGINPNSLELKTIRILSIIVIIFILWNLKPLENQLMFIIPLTTNKITFLNDLFDDSDFTDIVYIRKSEFTWFHFNDFKEITDFLETLYHDKCYIITFDLILNPELYCIGEPSLNLGIPILITKDSNPWLISKYLVEKIRICCDSYHLDEEIFSPEVSSSPRVLVRYREINLFLNTKLN
jgi:hypothetical protein